MFCLFLSGKHKFRTYGLQVQSGALDLVQNSCPWKKHMNLISISGYRHEQCLRRHILPRMDTFYAIGTNDDLGKAKLTHITQREQEHKSGTLEELSCSYQAEKQTSLQRTLQRVTQILQQHPLTHTIFSQASKQLHRAAIWSALDWSGLPPPKK